MEAATGPVATAQALLERYVQAKDLTRPQLMQDIYLPDAELTYSIVTDSIAFPSRTLGVQSITRTLVVDFAARFAQCKTYYVCDSAPAPDTQIAVVPWLVLMREPATACLRAGKGCYRWSFARDTDGALRAAAMHIHIERMEPIADETGDLLRAMQATLPYPWLPPAVMRAQFDALLARDARFAFLTDLRSPLDRPACEQRLREAAAS